MAVISQIKATSDNTNYNIRDDYSTWGGRNYAQNSGPGVVSSHLAITEGSVISVVTSS